jgi:hypothetical protein
MGADLVDQVERVPCVGQIRHPNPALIYGPSRLLERTVARVRPVTSAAGHPRALTAFRASR